MFAIILQESRFQTTAINRTLNKDGSTDWGLFQLNEKYWSFKMGDLEHNAKEALKCKKMLGYECWSSYKYGAHKKHLATAQQIVEEINK